MDPLRPAGPADSPHRIPGALLHGPGWALLQVQGGFMLQAVEGGHSIRLSPDEVAALRRGDLTAEAAFARNGFAIPTLNPAPQTNVVFSPEALRRAGLKAPTGTRGKPATGESRTNQKGAAPQFPALQPGLILIGVLALIAIALIFRA